MRTFEEDSKASARIFEKTVWPIIAAKCGGGQVTFVETMNSELAKQLDIMAGIDLWQVSDGHVRGIASRVQWPPAALAPDGEPWDTFTIRYERDSGAKTEFEKRREAIKTGQWIFPYLTVQAYVSDNGVEPEILSVAIVKTSTLYSFLDEEMATHGLKGQYVRKRATDNASFLWVSWIGLKVRYPDDIKIVDAYEIYQIAKPITQPAYEEPVIRPQTAKPQAQQSLFD